MISELYPTEIRTQSIGITKSTYYTFSALATMLFPKIKRKIGLHGIFFCFTGFSAVCSTWGYIKIPDTRGKTLVKVEEIFEKTNKN